MAAVKKAGRVSTGDITASLLQSYDKPSIVEDVKPQKVESKDEGEKRYNITVRMDTDIIDAVKTQTGKGKKEKDRSALVAAAVDIVLALSNENYTKLKSLAKDRNQKPGQYLNKLMDDK